jgi:hypothetical protein
VVVIAIAAVVISTGRQPADVSAGSPEALVQRYLQAVADDDPTAIRDTYTPDLRQRCDASEPAFAPAFPDDPMSFEADLISTREVGDDTVEVRVRITEYSGDSPFGGGGYDHTEVFVAETTSGGWGLAQAVWPYNVCPV